MTYTLTGTHNYPNTVKSRETPHVRPLTDQSPNRKRIHSRIRSTYTITLLYVLRIILRIRSTYNTYTMPLVAVIVHLCIRLCIHIYIRNTYTFMYVLFRFR